MNYLKWILKRNDRFCCFLVGAVLFISFSAQAQTSIPDTNPVTQDFDAMGSSLSLPTNWRMAAQISSPTWSGASSVVTQQASTGSPATGGTYNWGSTSTERAAGAMTSGNFDSPNNLLAYYRNTGTSNITSFQISYDAERYRINTAAAAVSFYYSLNGTSWTLVASGGVPSFATGASDYRFNPPYSTDMVLFTVNSITIAPNSDIYLRWNINTTGSNSQGIGIDNVAVTASFSPPCTPPTSQATNFSASNIQTYQMQVNWTRGNGNNVLVVARQGSAVNADPSNGFSYTANPTFGSGTQIGTGNYVVYDGAGTNVIVTGLSPATAYHYAIYEYNTTGICYLSPSLSGNATTSNLPNDDCSGATPLTISATPTCTTSTSGTSVGATNSGVGAILCNGLTGNADDDVWYSFVATSTSHIITVDDAGNLDAVVDLRSGACPGTNIACSDSPTAGATEIITATGLTIGATYLIRIYGYGAGSGTQGTFTVCVTTPVPPYHFRSKQTGSWTSASTWEVSTDNNNWSNALTTPTSVDLTITIRSGNTVTLSSGISFDQTVIESGGTLQISSGTAPTLANGTGVDLDCSGTFSNAGNVTWTGSMTVQSSGTYVHNTGFSSTNAYSAATLSPGCTWIYRGSIGNAPAATFAGRTYENLIIESTSGSFSLSMDGGTPLTINVDFTVGSGVTLTNNMTGTNVFAGNFENNGTITNSTGTQIYSFTGSGKTIGGTTATVFENMTVTSTATISLGYNIFIASGFTGTVNGTLNCGSYSINGTGGAFTLSDNATIITANSNGIGITGSIGVSGSKTFSSAANYVFEGAGTGLFNTSPASATVGQLTINSSGTSLDQPLTVSGNLNLSAGHLFLNNSDLIANNIPNLPAIGSNFSNYIVTNGLGSLQRSLSSGSAIFPVGKMPISEYMPCRLTGAGTYKVRVETTSPALPNSLPNQWNINGSVGSLDMDFQWPTNIFGTTTYLYKYNGSNWTTAQGPVIGGGAGAGPFTASFTGISNCCFNFTVGGAGALPVELAELRANHLDKKVVLDWRTYSERNNAFFSIEKSKNGIDFRAIGQVQGNGTSTEVHNYSFSDETPYVGINYYRLKQEDFDGQFEYSKVVSVFAGNADHQVLLYPTLASHEIHLRFPATIENERTIKVFDLSGRMVMETVFESEIEDLALPIEDLRNGQYFVRVQNGQVFETLRFVKQ